jgi:hypothetical protein
MINTHGKSTGEDDRGEDEDNQRCSLEHMHNLPDQALAPESSQYGNKDQVTSCKEEMMHVVPTQLLWVVLVKL